ncbi:MAG TPA: ATP-binding protein [Steroidobacteraceae bacterium]|nr:ATP-binding protein [Steroidobacteraceae bacterium]
MPDRWRLRAHTLFTRLTLILFTGLLLAHLLSFWLVFSERTQASMRMMLRFTSKDVASSVAILDRLPPQERSSWLAKLDRRNYHYGLESISDSAPIDSRTVPPIAGAIIAALGPGYASTASAKIISAHHVLLQLHLHDGAPLSVDLSYSPAPLPAWLPPLLAMQFAALGVLCWFAVRQATRPLAQLARAADALGRDGRGEALAEDGPLEVARAARAFNSMQRRISDYLSERMQLLAAISHDLQTPITRMRLRADLMDDAPLREKFLGDLDAMQLLVQEGIAYARDGQGITEPLRLTDMNALLDSVVCDYSDAGNMVRLSGHCDKPVPTRPQTLRRIITNLLDNALKFGSEPELLFAIEGEDRVAIIVRDTGPGIPHAQMGAVLQPFYRIEGSRNRETGGTGLGLAIAQQLTQLLHGTISMQNRNGGGLEVRVSLPTTPPL